MSDQACCEFCGCDPIESAVGCSCSECGCEDDWEEDEPELGGATSAWEHHYGT